MLPFSCYPLNCALWTSRTSLSAPRLLACHLVGSLFLGSGLVMCHQDSLTPARTSCFCPPLSLHFLLLSLALGSQGYLLSGLEGEPTVGWLSSLVWGGRTCPLVQPGSSGVCHPPRPKTRACLENWLPPSSYPALFQPGYWQLLFLMSKIFPTFNKAKILRCLFNAYTLAFPFPTLI